MARQRWTLALILICLPILATVITAFRVRDLPKAESVKLDIKKQKCEDCDVKVSHKLHSVKIESEKHVSEDLKKVGRDKQQVHQKAEIKPAHKFDIRSDEDDDDDDEKDILNIKTGFKQEVPASKVKLEASSKKSLNLDNDDDDDDDDDDIKASILKKLKVVDIKKSDQKPKQDIKSSKVKESSSKTIKHDDTDDDNTRGLLKPKAFEVKKPDLKLNQDIKRLEFKTLSKSKEVDDDDDDEYDDKIKRKPFEVKKLDLTPKQENKRPEFKLTPKPKAVGDDDDDDDDDDKLSAFSKLKVLEKKIDHKVKQDSKSSEVADSASKSREVDDDDDDDADDDDDDDDDDDFYSNTLSSIMETFSMLGLKIDPSLEPTPKVHDSKKTEHKVKDKKLEDDHDVKEKQKHEIVSKSTTTKSDVKPDIQKVKEAVTPFFKSLFGSHDDDDEDDDDDDDETDDDDDDDEDDDDDDEDDDKIKRKKFEVKKVDLQPRQDTKRPDFKLTPPKSKVVVDEDDDDKPSTFSKMKVLEKKVDHKVKQDTKSSESTHSASKSKEVDDDDEGDDDDDDNMASKKLKPKIDVKEKDKPDKKPLEPNKEVKVKIETPKKILKEDLKDKPVEKKTEIKPKPEVIKVEPIQKEIKEGKSKAKEGDPKTDKPVSKDKPKDVTEKPAPIKEDKKEKEPKHVEDKPKKEVVKKGHEKESAKTKSSQEKDEKDSSHEDKKTEKIVPEHKKKYPIKDTYNMHDFKKDIKSEFIKKSDESSKEKFDDGPEMSSSTESHLKHVTDALHRRNLLKSEFEDFYAFFPTFAPNFSRIHNPECRRHGQIVLRQLRGTKLWALNMLDATAKIPSGILQGNGIQLGDFDQCVGSRARVQLESGSVVKVQGKYCLARLDVKAEHPELEAPVHLAQAKNLIRSRIDDPGHFVPRFSTLSWGVCVPAACNPEDVEVVIKDAVKHYQHTSGVVVRVKVDEEDCHVEEGEWWEDWTEVPTLLTLSFYGVILLLVLVATLQDFFARRPEDQGEEADEKAEGNEKEEKETRNGKKSAGFLSGFSLYYTIGKLTAPGTDDEISCIHGVRGLATIALLIAHKFLPVAVMPYTNRLRITELASSPLWSWCRAGWMFTDCFLLLSGALTAHRISENDTGAPRRLFSRYLRLTPALLALVLFYAYIWDNISSGPMWGTFITKNAEVCQEGWWWNLLYVQNYFGFEDMCAPQTHQLALDMQLTILGCILVWLVQAKPGLNKLLIPGLHVFAAYSRYTTVRNHRLTMLAYHGVSVSQLYRTARLSYTSVLHRSTPYLVGLSLGLALKKPVEHGKFILTVGWLSSTALWCLVWWAGIDSGYLQYRYSASFAAQYASLAPIASALAIAWVIYAVHSSNGFLARFLCCGPLVMISRLSYAIYLTQFIVFITNVATVKTSREFTLISMIDVQEISAILLLSILLTVTFVLPMQNLHKVFTFPSRSASTDDAKESEDAEPGKEEKQEEEKEEVPQIRNRPHFIVHREVLEEIPEAEVEYEAQRDNEGLGEILEEEEDDEIGEESVGNNDDDLEIIEEEAGEDEEDEAWLEREHYVRRRSEPRDDDHDLDEWEWTANGNRNGAQYYRYSR